MPNATHTAAVALWAPCPTWCSDHRTHGEAHPADYAMHHTRQLRDGRIVVVLERVDRPDRAGRPVVSVGTGDGTPHLLEDLHLGEIIDLTRLLTRAQNLLKASEGGR